MMASWVLYTLMVTGLFWAAAWMLEKALRPLGFPTRWGWAAAMVGSQVVAVASLFRGPTVAMPPALPAQNLEVVAPPSILESISRVTTPPPLSPDLDLWVILAWVGLSIGVFLIVLRIALRLSSLRSSWASKRVDGRNVLISEGFGPAVVGLARPAIVFPRWALEADPRDRELMLRHEEEHLERGDIYLLFGGLLLVTAAPWNPLLWALGQRLRAAVEIDCDRRVLRATPRIRDYADLLLDLGSRGRIGGLAALTFSRPATFLEQRIRVMTDSSSPRFLRTVALSVLSALLVLGACEVSGPALTTPEPQNPVDVSMAEDESPSTALSVQGLRVSPPEGPMGEVTATGTAVNRLTGEPVGGVQVAIESLKRGTLSNTDGRFLIMGIPPGDHEVILSHPVLGVTKARIVFAGPERPQVTNATTPSEQPSELPRRVANPETGSVVGSVTEAGTEAPVQGVQVTIPSLDIGGMTNIQGRFLLMNVPPGTYTLHIQREGFVTQEAEVEVRKGESSRADPVLRR